MHRSALFWADHQTAGRGRGTRSWDDAPGLDLCVTFRVAGCSLNNPAHLAAAAPVVVVEALTPHLRDLGPLQIKWPNDVLLHGRKLCGILVDTVGRDPVTHLVGIGINVNRSDFPDLLADQATSMALATGQEFDRTRLLRDIAQHLETALVDLEGGRPTRLEECFRQSLRLMDTVVRVESNNEVFEARLRRLDFDTLKIDGQPPIPLAHVKRLDRRK